MHEDARRQQLERLAGTLAIAAAAVAFAAFVILPVLVPFVAGLFSKIGGALR